MTEKKRIENVYLEYQNSNLKKNWNNSPTKELVWENLLKIIKKELETSDLAGSQKKLLEIGCSAGGVLKRISPIILNCQFTGMDIRFAPLSDGKVYRPNFDFICADGTHIPFNDNCFEILLQSVCLSSILDVNIRKSIYQEILRVLKPGGIFFSYDMRFWSPNPNVTTISRRELIDNFPKASDIKFYPLTLVPPLARFTSSTLIYRILNSLPFLRSHWLCCIKK